jgi:hypothetical protein
MPRALCRRPVASRGRIWLCSFESSAVVDSVGSAGWPIPCFNRSASRKDVERIGPNQAEPSRACKVRHSRLTNNFTLVLDLRSVLPRHLNQHSRIIVTARFTDANSNYCVPPAVRIRANTSIVAGLKPESCSEGHWHSTTLRGLTSQPPDTFPRTPAPVCIEPLIKALKPLNSASILPADVPARRCFSKATVPPRSGAAIN